jgi:glycyl-tRNA synthetase beta chain
VRELTELQGVMGGIYAREEGLPEEVWKAIYFHYLPVGVEANAAPSRAQLGPAAVTWAAVSLADKLDTLVGLFAEEKPTGSRDPYGLRRAAQGIVKILVDLESVCGSSHRPALGGMVEQAYRELALDPPTGAARNPLRLFLMERLQHLMRSRGMGSDEVQIVTGGGTNRVADISMIDLIQSADAWKRVVGSPTLVAAAEAHKRAKRIVEVEWDSLGTPMPRDEQVAVLSDDAERALRRELDRVEAEIRGAIQSRQPDRAIDAIASIQPAVALFFEKVRVVVPDERLKRARLSLLRDLRDAVELFGDPSVLAHK